MKTFQIASLALACAFPIIILAACSSDSTPSAGPANKLPDPTTAVDSGGGSSGQPDSSTVPDGGGPNACDNGITFDNSGRVPAWPNVPQP